ncbi:MAG: hypothetical protein IPN34_05445 [Planctomycetes bacterium]|nr:hypothetical protein [Planctomycetota bacterium]
MNDARKRQDDSNGPHEERELARGLADAGLIEPEIDAFLAYSREMERELGARVMPARVSRWPWILFAAAAALLLCTGGAAAMLFGERGALLRELESVRGEREQLAREAREVAAERAQVQQELREQRADAKVAQAEIVRYFQGRLLERAAMGDRSALPTASFLSDMTRDLPTRKVTGDFRDAWSRLVPPLDPLGFSPSSPYEELVLAGR